MKRVLLLTGSPGVGKTTVLTNVVNILKEKGYSVGGMISQEVREGGVRVGFEIFDLTSEKRADSHTKSKHLVHKLENIASTSKTSQASAPKQ
jgi:nucleoside-triphosphatase THEP1